MRRIIDIVRVGTFIWTLVNSTNITVRCMTNYMIKHDCSVIGKNIKYFMYKYNIMYNMWRQPISCIFKRVHNYWNTATDIQNHLNACHIRELCILRDCYYTNTNNPIPIHDINFQIDYLCTY